VIRFVNSRAEADAVFTELGSLVDLVTVEIVLGVTKSQAHHAFERGQFTRVVFFGRRMVPWQEVCHKRGASGAVGRSVPKVGASRTRDRSVPTNGASGTLHDSAKA
jgi:hypothetical protein